MLEQLHKYRFYLLLLIIPVIILLLPAMERSLRVDNSLSIWFKQSDPVLKTYEQFQQSFGSDEIITIIYKPSDEALSASLKKLDQLTQELDTLPETQMISSLTSLGLPERKGINVRKTHIVNPTYSDSLNLGRIKEYELLSQYYYNDKNGAFRLLIQLENLPAMDERRGEIIQSIKHITNKILPEDQVAFGGVGVIFEALNQFSQKQFGIFLSLCYLFIFIAIIWLYKSWKVLVYALLVIICSTIITLGCYGLAGHQMNLMTTFIPTIIVLLGILDVIHVINQHNKTNASDKYEALRKVWKPCLYTTLTTMAGFLALYFTPITVLQDFGVYSAIGIALCFIFTMYFGLIFLPRMQKQANKDPWTSKIINYSQRRVKILRWSVLVLLVISIIGLFQLKVDTYTLGYFPDDHEVVEDHKQIEAWWGNYMPLELIVQPKENVSLFSQDLLQDMNVFSSGTTAKKDISSAFGYHTIIDIGMRLSYGENTREAYQSQQSINNVVSILETQNPALYNKFISENAQIGRLTLFGRMATAGELKVKMDQLTKASDSIFRGTAELKPAGYLPMYAKIINYISYSQLVSLSAAIALIFVLVYIYLRDFRLAFISICTNLFPLIIMFGAVGLLGIDIDLATASIAAIALSFCIDDTIHILYHYQRESKSKSPSTALDNTFMSVGPAVVITSVLLFIGYGLMLFSPLKTVQLFGGLTAIMVIGALLSQFVIFPLLLNLLKK